MREGLSRPLNLAAAGIGEGPPAFAVTWNGRLPEIPGDSTFHFEPYFGWKGHIERR